MKSSPFNRIYASGHYLITISLTLHSLIIYSRHSRHGLFNEFFNNKICSHIHTHTESSDEQTFYLAHAKTGRFISFTISRIVNVSWDNWQAVNVIFFPSSPLTSIPYPSPFPFSPAINIFLFFPFAHLSLCTQSGKSMASKKQPPIEMRTNEKKRKKFRLISFIACVMTCCCLHVGCIKC